MCSDGNEVVVTDGEPNIHLSETFVVNRTKSEYSALFSAFDVTTHVSELPVRICFWSSDDCASCAGVKKSVQNI